MKLIALIVFIVLALATGVLLLTWKKKRSVVEKPTVKTPSAKELSEKTSAKNEIVSGTYYLINQVFINGIQYTDKADIPSEYLETIARELETIKYNETPFAATSMGNLTLRYSDGKTIELETVYNMGKNRYDPIIYLEGKQYYISEEFRNSIQQLSQLN